MEDQIESQVKNKTRIKWYIAGIVLIVIAIIYLIMYQIQNGLVKNDQSNPENGVVAGASSDENNDYLMRLAKDLSAKGAVLYGADWCPHCKAQKKLFGDAAQYINYVECDPTGPNANPDECRGKGIEQYPTWIYNGQKTTGTKTLSQLAQMVGFTK